MIFDQFLRAATTGTLWRLARLVAILLSASILAPVASAQTAGTTPVWVDIPEIGTHANVVPVGQDGAGALGVPTDPDTVGWYAFGEGLGAPGNTLLDGHVDWGGRLRVFGLLKYLQPGDTFQITDGYGNAFTYSVLWNRLYIADTAPVEDILGETSDPEVTLITCGGDFDHSIHMYLSRWVTRAVQIDPAPPQ